MTIDQITIFSIIILTFSLFTWGKWRYDIVSIIALCILFIADQLLGGEKSNLIMESSISTQDIIILIYSQLKMSLDLILM